MNRIWKLPNVAIDTEQIVSITRMADGEACAIRTTDGKEHMTQLDYNEALRLWMKAVCDEP